MSNSQRAQDAFDDMTQGRNSIFRYNPGREGVIFPPHHPYYGKRGYRHCQNPHLATSLGDGEECRILRNLQKNKEEVKALTEEQKAYRKELQKEAIAKYKGQVVHNEIDITITVRGIKEYLNQPHAQYFAKNELVRNLPDLIKSAKYIGKMPYHKTDRKSKIVYSHFLEISIANEPNWIIVRENHAGSQEFYSITDTKPPISDK